MIDDINEEAEEETTQTESQPKLKWYLIDKERTFCKVWNFMITMLIIYNLFVTPFIVVFPTVYEWCEPSTEKGFDIPQCSPDKDSNDDKSGWKSN